MTATTLLKSFSIATALIISGSFAVHAGAGDDCKRYAQASAKQQQLNLRKNCGFKGTSWSTDLKQHQTWCETAPASEWQAMVRARQEQLQTCK